MVNKDTVFDWMNDIKKGRTTWEHHWRDCALYTQPSKSDINESQRGVNKGRKRTETMYDGTAIEANEFFASAVHGLLVSYKNEWFAIESVDAELNKQQEIQAWYDNVTKKMHAAIHNPIAKFTETLDETLLDIGTFGTGIMSVLDGNKSQIRFNSSTVNEEYLSENADGVIDASFRVMEWSVRKLIERFPETAMRDPDIKKAAAKNKETMIEIVHAVYPRDQYIPSKKDVKNLPFESVYLTTGNKILLEESGFHEYPKPAARWRKRSNETYGRGPCMNVLPDILMLQTAERQLIQANELILNPPLDVPNKGYVGKIRTYAGGINYRKSPGGDRMQPINTIGNLAIPEDKAEQKRNAIRRGFYNHIFTMPDEGQKTATEVIERRAEKFQIVMPMMGRIQSELMSPILERVFAIQFRAGVYGEPPEALRGTETRVRYLSKLAQIQSQTDADAILQTFGATAQISELYPEVRDNFNGDEAIKLVAKSFGYPPTALNKDKIIEDLREQRKEQLQRQQRVEESQAAADVVNKTAGQQPPQNVTA